MASVVSEPVTTYDTVADVVDHLGVPASRVIVNTRFGQVSEQDAVRPWFKLCELVDGFLVRKPMGWYESRLAVVLAFFLERYLETRNLGIVLGESGLIRVEPDQLRMPDVSFIAWDHFPDRVLPPEQVMPVVPDLAVEILSPDNTKKEMERKRREYFAGGAKLVWEVNPPKRQVTVYTAPDVSTLLDEDGMLDGGTVLPGFTLSIREWFERAGPRG